MDAEELKKNTVPTITIVGTDDGIREFADQTGTVAAHHEIVYIEGGDHWNLPGKGALRGNLHKHFARNAPQGS